MGNTDHGPDELDAAESRRLAVSLFNHVWALLAIPDRTPAQDDEMIHAAHASRHHWAKAGTAAHLGRGEWQCSLVYATLGRGEPALWHARRCLAQIEAAGAAGVAEDWDLASAYEGLARATAVSGDAVAAAGWKAKAVKALEAIADPEDRATIEAQIASLP